MSEDLELRLPERVAATHEHWPGGGYLFRPEEVLVATDAIVKVRKHIDALGGTLFDEAPVENNDRLVRVRVDVDVPNLISRVRSVEHGYPPDVSPNHVIHQFSHIRFFSRLPPAPASALPDLAVAQAADPVKIAVIDSGAWDHDWYRGRVTPLTGDHREKPDENNNGKLDLCGGHGTFVAGLVLQHAPAAAVLARRIPDYVDSVVGRTGVLDDLQLAGMLDAIGDDVDVVNISMGAWTDGDIAPPATAAAVARLRARNPNCVVVAAAGNEPTTRPSWPAALKGVIAVGALDGTGQPWAFSARGSWVDAWADGVDAHSTFFVWPDEVMEHPAGGTAPFDGFAEWTGTSFSAPRVSGTIAAMADGPRGARRAACELLGTASPLAGQYGVVVPTSS